MNASDHAVFVETAGRLHFGVLDLRGSLGRWFGGIGAAAPAPTLLVSATASGTFVVDGEDRERATAFAREFLAHFRLPTVGRVHVHRALPAHAGLGSGTQLALAIGRALAELNGLAADAPTLARATGRTRRSAVGTWTFAGGGLVVEGGRRADSQAVAPLLARLPFPPAWRCVIAVPGVAAGISGIAEAEAFARLAVPPEHDAQRVAHLVLMALLPALASADLPMFGAALNAIQAINGRWFAAVQGGMYAPGPGEELARRMAEWGAAGVGQSSWGPAVYGIVDGEAAGARLADRVRTIMGDTGIVVEDAFPTEGARVWRAPVAAVTR